MPKQTQDPLFGSQSETQRGARKTLFFSSGEKTIYRERERTIKNLVMALNLRRETYMHVYKISRFTHLSGMF